MMNSMNMTHSERGKVLHTSSKAPFPVVYRCLIATLSLKIPYFDCFCLVICRHCVSVVCCCQSLAQQALIGTINSSMHAVQQAQADLGHVDNLPPLGHDLVSRVTTSYFSCGKHFRTVAACIDTVPNHIPTMLQ